jgi:hypothetical protein
VANDEAKVQEIVGRLMRAEAAYGYGYDGYEPWLSAYRELGQMFGFDEDWRETEGEHLHEQHWKKAAVKP